MVLYVYLPCIDSGVNLLEERYPKYTYSDVKNWVPVSCLNRTLKI